MTQKYSIAQIFLRLFVIALGIEIGAGVFETLVIVPLWAGSAPDSLIAYYQHKAARPEMTVNSGEKFWMFATPTVGLLSIAVLLTSNWANSAQRRFRAVGGVLALLVVISTFVWFVPNILLLQSEAVLTMDKAQMTNLANWWVSLNWIRVFLFVAAWLAALRALTTAPEKGFE